MADNFRQDPGLTLEEVHELLDLGQRVRVRLGREKGKAIALENYYELHELVMGIVGYYSIYSDNPLGIQPSVLNKLKRYVGTFDLRTAKLITDRAITFLKSRDWPPKSQVPTSEIVSHSKKAIPATLTFQAKTWVALRSSPEVAKKIAQISVLLDSVIEHTAHSNLPEDERLLTEIERNQLIAILETALNLLKGPLVEKGLFDRAGDILKRGAKKAAETQTEEGLGKLFGLASERLLDLITSLF